MNSEYQTPHPDPLALYRKMKCFSATLKFDPKFSRLME